MRFLYRIMNPSSQHPNLLSLWLARVVLCLFLLLGFSLAHAWERITFYHNDPFGNPVLATDEQGNVVRKENYRPFGERTVKSPASADNKIAFAGRPFDPNTGLSYHGARYYDPQLGRFLGIDPKEVDPNDLHSFNRYAYANNNPYKYVDPDGRIPIPAILIGIGLWLGTEILLAPTAPSGSGVVYPTSFPDMTGVFKAGGVAIGIGAMRQTTAKEVAKAAKGGTAAEKGTSHAARREAMRDAGIPTSQQPVSQSRSASGREYSYDMPTSGGGNQRMSVQQQTMDRSHPGQPHWEAGRVKIDHGTGNIRTNNYGRPALTNDKSKVDY